MRIRGPEQDALAAAMGRALRERGFGDKEQGDQDVWGQGNRSVVLTPIREHDLYDDPPHALSRVYRETCKRCGKAKLAVPGGVPYGSAVKEECTGVEAEVFDPRFTPDVQLAYTAEQLIALLDREEDVDG